MKQPASIRFDWGARAFVLVADPAARYRHREDVPRRPTHDTKAERVEHGDWQTPLALAREIVAVVARTCGPPAAVVEPTCGRGAFLVAAHEAFPRAALLGLDRSRLHVGAARRALRDSGARSALVRGGLRVADFFRIDWKDTLGTLPAPVLVLGNPPWVTSSVVGRLGGTNVPEKGRRQGFSGLESITGQSNFDISEWMIQALLEAGMDRGASLAVLCKSTVARKIVAFVHARRFALGGAVYGVDSRLHFDASVDAVLFVATPARRPSEVGRFAVHDTLGSTRPTRTMGVVDGRVSADTEAFVRTRALTADETDPEEPTWRSGIKHDCAAVMELSCAPEGLRNGTGERVDLEPERVYPLLKGSDVANGRATGRRAVLVPQRSLGEDTAALAGSLPRTFAYLTRYEQALGARKSRVYQGRAPFAIFGIGPYAFAPFKVAICGLYKRIAFRVIVPHEEKPVMVDDTVTFLPFDDLETASRVATALNGPLARSFFEARVFWDAKRPVGKALLATLSIRKLLAATEL